MQPSGCVASTEFVRDSDQARRIRTLALKRGGKLTDGNFIPNCETTFEECEKTMTCTFGPRVKLVVHRKTNDVDVYVDGNGLKPTNVNLYRISCTAARDPTDGICLINRNEMEYYGRYCAYPTMT